MMFGIIMGQLHTKLNDFLDTRPNKQTDYDAKRALKFLADNKITNLDLKIVDADGKVIPGAKIIVTKKN